MNKSTNVLLSKVFVIKKWSIGLISLAFIISIAIMSAQRLFNATLTEELSKTSAALLTADIEIASTRPISQPHLNTILTTIPNHTSAKRQIFSSMAQINNQSILVEVLAVSQNYPLRGHCLAQTNHAGIQSVSELLHSHTNGMIISKQVSEKYDVSFGESIKIGHFIGTVIGILTVEPDINIQSVSLGPRVYISIQNSHKIGLDLNVSRIYHSTFFSFKTMRENISVLANKIQKSLGISSNNKTIQGSYGPSQPIVVRTYNDITDTIQERFNKLNQYYLYVSLFTLILSGFAFAFIIWISILNQLRNIGHLRFLGVSAAQVNYFFIRRSIQFAVAMVIPGMSLGIVSSHIIYNAVASFQNLHQTMIYVHPMDLGFIAIFSIICVGLITACILTMMNGSIKMSHFFIHQPRQITVSSIIGISIIMIVLAIIFLMANHIPWSLIGWVIIALVCIFVVLYGLDLMVFSQFKRLYSTALPIQWRLAFKCLSESYTLRQLSFISISIAIITILTISHYEKSFINAYSPQKKASRPYLFIIDLYSNQLNQFKALVPNNTQLSMIVRARISAINQIPVTEYASQINNRYFLDREQNLSSRIRVSDSEKIIDGTWFNSNNGMIEASIEERFAKRLQLTINDTIEFDYLGERLTVTITSIRQVNWETLNPNFFIIIEPPYLNHFPKSWVGSIFESSDDNHQHLQFTLPQAFPNVGIIDIKNTSEKIINFLRICLLSVKIGAILCSIVGGLLFLLMVSLLKDSRHDSYSMLYWMGLSRSSIQCITIIEQSIFLGVTYIISHSMSIGLIKIICTYIVNIPAQIDWAMSMYCLLGIIGLTGIGLYKKDLNRTS